MPKPCFVRRLCVRSEAPVSDVDPVVSDHMRTLARKSIAKRNEFHKAAKDLVARTREAQDLPETVTDLEVIERITALVTLGQIGGAA